MRVSTPKIEVARLCMIAVTLLATPLLAQLAPPAPPDSMAAEFAFGTSSAPVAPIAHLRADPAFGKFSLSFEANRGQTSDHVQFLSRGNGYTLFLSPGETVLSLRAPDPQIAQKHAGDSWAERLAHARLGPETSRSTVLRMQLIGSSPKAAAAGEDELAAQNNYLIGSDPAKWRTGVPTYARVRYRDVYPGIDLLFYGNVQGALEHDFIVAPGADPGSIAFGFGEDQGITTDSEGALLLPTAAGDLKLATPVAYQDVNGQRIPVSVSYDIGTNRLVRFRLGDYDRRSSLVIDPVVVFTAVFGGTGDDSPQAVAVDAAGNVYVAGTTSSVDFPILNPGPWNKNTLTGFVSKINPAGTALLYSTYFGGSSTSIQAIKVDSSGRIYIAGSTGTGLPVVNARQSSFGGGDADAFVAVINPQGNSLAYSTYLGGSKTDYAMALALDDAGNAYITGRTDGAFPALHSLQPQDPQGAFVAKFSAAGVLQYSSIYANVWGQSTAIAADKYGAAYVTGYTNTPPPEYRNPPTPRITPGAFRTTCLVECAIVFKLNPSGDSLAYATYLTTNSTGFGIAVDSDLNAYVGGATQKGFPVWSTGFQRTFGGATDGFVAKLNSTGSNLIWSTYLGGNQEDVIYSLAMDQHRQIYVTGSTTSPNFPLKAPVQTYSGIWDVTPWQPFVTTLSGSLGSIVYYSTYFGPPGRDVNSPSLAVDKALNVYVTGDNRGIFKPTPGALAPGDPGNPGGGSDAFVTKLSIMADLWLSMSADSWVWSGNNTTFFLVVKNKGPDFAVNVRVSDTLPPNTTFVSYEGGGGTCTTPPVGGTGTFTCQLPRLEKGAWWVSKLTVKVNIPPGNILYDHATVVSNMQDPDLTNNSVTSIGVGVD